MMMPVSLTDSTVQTLFKEASAQALQQQRHVMDVLEELLALSPEAFIAQLSALLHYPIASMREMREWQVLFDKISYADAQKKNCLLFTNHQGQHLLVFSDPFDQQLPLWVQHTLDIRCEWRLAHRLDISAYLSGEEESMRAMDGIGISGDSLHDAEDEAVMQLSLKSIHEDANPIVKLVNSTLYDALKTGASDVHLESHATGLAVKYRIDGVMRDQLTLNLPKSIIKIHTQ